MALNPVAYTEKIVRGFLKYQLTAYPFADPTLYAQMRELLSLEHTRETPLLKGPYVSLSRAFRPGASFKALVGEGLAHPLLESLHPYPTLYSHQEKAFRSISAGKTTLVSTGTGSGKTESFLYPILSRCLKLRDENAEPGIVAVLVYPMNALAEDQLQRLRGLLTGTGITFGMYVGKTPERSDQVTGTRLTAGASQATYQAALAKAQAEKRNVAIHPVEERASRQELREKPPRILLTNVKQLELLLTRSTDIDLFTGARLEYLVFDEAHTYSGAVGAETACLIRRLRTFCGRSASETTCIATSATIADPEGGVDAGRDFAARFFGVDREGVTLIGEEYEADVWATHRSIPLPPPGEPSDHLQAVLSAVDAPNASVAVPAAYLAMTGTILPSESWEEALHADLSRNQIVFALADILQRPMSLEDLVDGLRGRIGRKVPEAEILTWLALGAAARQDARPLLRPVMHGFIRGVSGAVATFPLVGEAVRLHLSSEDAVRSGGEDGIARLPILTCNTCGQHYFEHHAADFSFTKGEPGGGDLKGGSRYWKPLESSLGGKRLVLTDRPLATLDEDEDDDAEDSDKLAEVFLCRGCGALHAAAFSTCASCGRDEIPMRLLAVAQNPLFPGRLARCISCAAPGAPRGGSYREPARPVRAVAVADVHILAQEMIHYAERPRLLVFADNRQDAAFQAGWMRDHARRFRFRAIIMERIQKGALSVGDLAAYLEHYLDADPELSESLIPEVWQVAKPTATGTEHATQRRLYLRLQLLRELTTSLKDRRGLEPLGRLRIDYHGLAPEIAFISTWAFRLALEPERLRDGIAALLDRFRRGFYLFDPETKAFSRFWMDGDFEIQRGYLPKLKGIPKGLKLEKGSKEETRLTYWLGSSGDTVVRQVARGWGVNKDDQEEFIRQLWQSVTDELKLLVPVTLTGSKGKPLPSCPGAFQIDADRLLLSPSVGIWRCRKCRRAQVRPTPSDRCMAWRCDGTLIFEGESQDHYDLGMLDGGVRMLRPREHSAQVPHAEREKIELQFKADTGEAINTLVCTPTLELGVDIGALDTVLMRNVPPLPANYWQRAGRAGRRHRMAVNLTYARTNSHDLAYFNEPLKMLQGRVEPPRFNLRNELMVAKHVHATVLTRLNQIGRSSKFSAVDRAELADVVTAVFPRQVKLYLFDEAGHVRPAPYDVSMLGDCLKKHQDDLLPYLSQTFAQGWPTEASEAVTPERLAACLNAMTVGLQGVVKTLHHRLHWCLGQIQRLNVQRSKQGTLKPDEDALFRRCDRLVKRLKGESRQGRSQAQGFDDTNTFAALAAEGFLPGYGLEIGSVLGAAMLSQSGLGESDFDLPRPTAMALREYVPGNLIYANGHRFVPRYYHLEAHDAPLGFQVDPVNQTVLEAGSITQDGAATLTTTLFPAIPICDVDLAHASHIGDEEDSRFQLGVDVYGYERDRHEGGTAYQWGERAVHFRRGVHLRLVNVGPTSRVATGALGYPVCQVCGQSRSPFASSAEQTNFQKDHEERCGRKVVEIGFYADLVADALSLPDCASREEAFSLAESLRIGAAQVLEMDRDDLEVLVIGQPGSDHATALLFDPMPGGSGLLQQIVARFKEVVDAASAVALGCPGGCERSCIDCLQTFRNAYYHKHLNRKLVCEKLEQWGSTLHSTHPIPVKTPNLAPVKTDLPVNTAEDRLRLLLYKAGFPEAEWHKQIKLGHPLGSTSPDCFYAEEDDSMGICIYLDGLSQHIHGNTTTRQKDLEIREELGSQGYSVLRIVATDLWDVAKMSLHFAKLGKLLIGKEHARKVSEDTSWFLEGDSPAQP